MHLYLAHPFLKGEYFPFQLLPAKKQAAHFAILWASLVNFLVQLLPWPVCFYYVRNYYHDFFVPKKIKIKKINRDYCFFPGECHNKSYLIKVYELSNYGFGKTETSINRLESLNGGKEELQSKFLFLLFDKEWIK